MYNLDIVSQFWTSLLGICPVLTIASWPANRFLGSQVRWSGIPISFRIFQFVVIHIVRGFSAVKQAEVKFFFNSLAFSMLAIWSLITLPFLNPACTSGSSQLMYCWSLAWGILSNTLLACEMSATVWQLEHSLALPFFGIGMKTDLV